MMITHTLGAYEDPETNELHFDVLQSVFVFCSFSFRSHFEI